MKFAAPQGSRFYNALLSNKFFQNRLTQYFAAYFTRWAECNLNKNLHAKQSRY